MADCIPVDRRHPACEHVRIGPIDAREVPARAAGLPRHVALRWAQRLKRVFGIEIERCARCAARLKIVASIEDPR